jgi:hypothetical protein
MFSYDTLMKTFTCFRTVGQTMPRAHRAGVSGDLHTTG